MNYRPKRIDKPIPGYIFTEAYADMFAYQHVLPSYLYKHLRSYNYRESDYYRSKYYSTESKALDALENAKLSLFYEIEFLVSRFDFTNDQKEKLMNYIKV